MIDFVDGRYDVLCSTTIIESGLDIPRANTMIVNHADRFGLAQLYQLRGRIGRSRERAFCYLVVPAEAALSAEAKQRLAVLQRFTELGAGFQVATHDLEIRGAGDLLGDRQHGAGGGGRLRHLRAHPGGGGGRAARASPSSASRIPRSRSTCRPSCPTTTSPTPASGWSCTGGWPRPRDEDEVRGHAGRDRGSLRPAARGGDACWAR